MSRENVETLQAVAKATGEGDATAWLRAMDPDVRVYPRSEEPGVRAVYEGSGPAGGRNLPIALDLSRCLWHRPMVPPDLVTSGSPALWADNFSAQGLTR